MQAAARRAERAAERRHRELHLQHREATRRLEVAQAADEVESYQHHLVWLSTLHRTCSEPIDWLASSRAPEPLGPLYCDQRERTAIAAWESYQPGWWDRLLSRQQQKARDLEAAVEQARIEDQRAFAAAQSRWQDEHRDWQVSCRLARRVLDQEPEALHQALQSHGKIAEIDGLGKTVNLEIDPQGINAKLEVNGMDIVPRHSKSQLKSGKLSVKELPKRQFHTIYQDHVCSCALRLGRELFALLPVSKVLITARDRALDPATGHLMDRPILSSYLLRATLQSLNLRAIDPSEAMQNFLTRMDFKATRGFAAVEPMTWQDIEKERAAI